MNTLRLALTALALCIALTALAGEPIEKTFLTKKDTFITNEKQGTPGDRSHRNYGGAHALMIDTQYNGEKSHVLIEFDLAAIPKNATITAATLAMGPRIKPMVGTAEAIELRRMLIDDWEEGTQGAVTHKEKSGASWIARRYTEEGPEPWQQSGAIGLLDCDKATKITLVGNKQMAELDTGVDVLAHVQAWHAERKAALGWLVRTTNTKINLYRWASSNAPETKGPTLKITYTLPDAPEKVEEKEQE